MAVAAGWQPSIAGVTSTLWKGSLVLSAKSDMYHHVNPAGGGGSMSFTGAKATHITGGAQEIGTGGAGAIFFDNVAFDTDDYFDPDNPQVLTVPEGFGGVFVVGFSLSTSFLSGSPGYINAGIYRNDSELLLYQQLPISSVLPIAILSGDGLVGLDEGDEIKLIVQLDTFTDASYLQDGQWTPSMWLGRWV